MKKRTAAVLAAFLIPYITTLAVSGRVQGADGEKIGGNSDRTSGWESQTDGRQILLDREDGGRNNGTGYAVPLEEYLIGLTAVQIPDGYPKEAVKAQAILARTALYRGDGRGRFDRGIGVRYGLSGAGADREPV